MEALEARMWDSEKRSSPYSTVCDPSEDDYCEGCDSDVVYSGPEDSTGTCKCDEARLGLPTPAEYRQQAARLFEALAARKASA